MKQLYTQNQFDNSKVYEKLPLECYYCKNEFLKSKKLIQLQLKNHSNKDHKTYSNSCRYCNTTCQKKHYSETHRSLVNCKNCNKEFYKSNSAIKNFPNHFCGKSCLATYKNTHKTKCHRRSKIELYFEEQLTSIYPNIEFHFNRRDTINSELDIYIPSLNLAFELNGIFHYEPIFGPEKLSQIQNNDQRKFQACAEKNISFCTIDISSITYVKPEKMQKFVNIALDIINNHIKDNNSKNDNKKKGSDN